MNRMRAPLGRYRASLGSMVVDRIYRMIIVPCLGIEQQVAKDGERREGGGGGGT